MTEVDLSVYFIVNHEVLLKEMAWELRKGRLKDIRLGTHRFNKKEVKVKWAVDKVMRDLGLNYLEASSIIDTEFLERLGY